MQKLLIGVIGVLFVVAAGEILYLSVSQPKPKQQIGMPTAITPTLKPEPTINPNFNGINKNTFEWVLYNTTRIKNGILKSSFLNSVYQGKIVEIDTKDGVFTDKNIRLPYKLYIKIQGKTLQDTNRFFFDSNELKKTKFSEEIEGLKEKPINLEQLKVGDLIAIKETIDLTKEIEYSTITTTVLRLKK